MIARVLLVEPDLVLARQFADSIERAGYRIDVVHSAASALDALDTHDYQLAIVELQLGSHNGIELLYEIRTYPDIVGLPVIAMGHINFEQLNELVGYRTLQVAKYLYKPEMTPESLIAAVTDVIDDTSNEQELS